MGPGRPLISWFNNEGNGGGMFNLLGSHFVDLIVFLTKVLL